MTTTTQQTPLTSLEWYDYESAELVDSTHQVITFTHWESKERIHIPYYARSHKKGWTYYTKNNSIVHFNTLEEARAYIK